MPTTEPQPLYPGPKPTRSLVVSSVMVIVFSIILASLSLRWLIVANRWDFLMACWGIILPSLVGVLQYAACFRRSHGAAKALFYFHMLGIFGFSTYGVLFIVAAFDKDQIQPEPLIAFCVLLFLAMLAAVSMWKVLHWADELASVRLSEPEDLFRKQRPFQISIYELLLAMTIVAIIAGLTSSMIHLGL